MLEARIPLHYKVIQQWSKNAQISQTSFSNENDMKKQIFKYFNGSLRYVDHGLAFTPEKKFESHFLNLLIEFDLTELEGKDELPAAVLAEQKIKNKEKFFDYLKILKSFKSKMKYWDLDVRRSVLILENFDKLAEKYSAEEIIYYELLILNNRLVSTILDHYYSKRIAVEKILEFDLHPILDKIENVFSILEISLSPMLALFIRQYLFQSYHGVATTVLHDKLKDNDPFSQTDIVNDNTFVFNSYQDVVFHDSSNALTMLMDFIYDIGYIDIIGCEIIMQTNFAFYTKNEKTLFVEFDKFQSDFLSKSGKVYYIFDLQNKKHYEASPDLAKQFPKTLKYMKLYLFKRFKNQDVGSQEPRI